MLDIWELFQYKSSLSLLGDFQHKDESVSGVSYHRNTGKMAFLLYWIHPGDSVVKIMAWHMIVPPNVKPLI